MADFCFSSVVFGIELSPQMLPGLFKKYVIPEHREEFEHVLKSSEDLESFESWEKSISNGDFGSASSMCLEYSRTFQLACPPLELHLYPHDRQERWEDFFGVIGHTLGHFAGVSTQPPQPLVYPDVSLVRNKLAEALNVDGDTLTLRYFSIPGDCHCCS